MKSTIIACKTLEEELLYVMESLSMHPPVVWLESGLHNNPAHLHERLQEELDKITGQELVIMAFGFCGNSVLHLKTGNYTLILPRVDDCISLLLGSVSVKAALKMCIRDRYHSAQDKSNIIALIPPCDQESET